MPSEARLENFRILILKNSKILKKKYAERSEAKKIRKNLLSILGPQNLSLSPTCWITLTVIPTKNNLLCHLTRYLTSRSDSFPQRPDDDHGFCTMI